METSEAPPRGAVAAPDLAEVFQHNGPFATVVLATEQGIENAAQRSEQRWRALRSELADARAGDEVLEAVDRTVPEAHLEGNALAVVAAGEGVLHVEHGRDLPPRDLVRWASLPSVVPVVEWRQAFPPHVVVLADRRGADMVAFRHERAEVRREAGGDDDPLTKSAPGGWSQRRYQQRAENTWEENAEDVATELAKLVGQVDARLVVVAGDVRALQLLREELPDEVLGVLRSVQGGRSPDGSMDDVDEEVRGLVDQTVARETEEILEKFREEVGQSDRAADGPAATLEALTRAQVDVLLVHDMAEDERTGWFGPAPTQAAMTPDPLRAMGVEEPTEGRLVDVMLRAALGTGAAIRVVPPVGGPSEGVGAILRWSS